MNVSARVSERWRVRVADLRGRGVYAGYPNRSHCIFIHIPKTAGTSIVTALFGTPSRHVPYFMYEQANPRKFRAFFKFTFVRNPWDRLLSTYFFLRHGGMNEHDRLWSRETLSAYASFDDFVRFWLNEANSRSWIHFLPQSHFVCDRSGKIMVDFVGRFERIQDDFAAIGKRLGLKVRLPVSNVSAHTHFSKYYTDETREIVRRIYARDIDLFGYAFDCR